MLLGCIADDFTGATDLANTLSRQGMRTVQTIGMPVEAPDDAHAVVVALKSRTIAAADAVDQSLAACRWLRSHGARQIFFKYCSTFDSTDRGNIGPVADALMTELKTSITTICPAFPENGRTIYMGHLFVGSALLSESSMRNHPLTPMTDSNLAAVMARQSARKVGHVAYTTVRNGAAAIISALKNIEAEGINHAVIDAIDNDDLLALGAACASLKLVTGSSGAALGLPENFRRANLLQKQDAQIYLPKIGGRGAVLSGSCSPATLAQVKSFQAGHLSFALEANAIMTQPKQEVERCLAWVAQHPSAQQLLIYSSDGPAEVAERQQRYGRDRLGTAIESVMGKIAQRLASMGIRRFVVAGGETSGAVTQALGISALDIGPQIAPGIPATVSRGDPRYGLVLKSGNFGGADFFVDALGAIP
jgi:3-dehydrotetronate 4-kinase